MVKSVSSWRCKCGTRVKVVGETKKELPIELTLQAACPSCGQQQSIYAHKIVSITAEDEDSRAFKVVA